MSHYLPSFALFIKTGRAINEGGTLMDSSMQTMSTSDQLKFIFNYYCTFGRTGGKGVNQDSMDSSNFMKFAKECPGLIDKRLNRTETDLIFTKAKPKSKRRLDFSHFLDALSAMASKKYSKYEPKTAFSILLAQHVFQNR